MRLMMQRFTHYAIPFGLFMLLLTALLASPAFAQISVSITDNVVVLDNRQRSGEIGLLSMTADPVEFQVEAVDVPDEVIDGRDLLRWTPARTLVPANRSSPLRMVFRPPSDLAPGEYVVRLAVQSRRVDYQPNIAVPDGDEPAMSMGVAIQPVLPVTVYLRHQVESPELTISKFEPAPDDDRVHGFFRIRKHPDAISFVGTVALIGQDSGNSYTQGRLRMGQTADERRVRVPRLADDEVLSEPVCLHIWPSFPARGQPEQRVCSG